MNRAVEGRGTDRLRRAAAAYFWVQGLGASVWWCGLLWDERWRRPFVATGAPDCTLLAFGPGDWIGYIGGSFAVAWGMTRRSGWVRTVLALHAGAAAYAACYTATLAALDPATWLGAVLMAPSLAVPLATLRWLDLRND